MLGATGAVESMVVIKALQASQIPEHSTMKQKIQNVT